MLMLAWMNTGPINKPAEAAVTPVASVSLDIHNLVPKPPVHDYTVEVLTPLQQAEAREAAARVKAAQDAAEQARQAQLAQVAEAAKIAAQNVSYANSYDWGNCTYYVASQRQVPSNWGNANQWLYNAQAAGYSTGSVPQVGAIAQTSVGYYGHVALVVGVGAGTVTVREMNVEGLGVIDTATYPAGMFSYIY